MGRRTVADRLRNDIEETLLAGSPGGIDDLPRAMVPAILMPDAGPGDGKPWPTIEELDELILTMRKAMGTEVARTMTELDAATVAAAEKLSPHKLSWQEERTSPVDDFAAWASAKQSAILRIYTTHPAGREFVGRAFEACLPPSIQVITRCVP